MNVFRILDDFLIDRAFQPVSNALARWISCYGIAAFLMTGFAVAQVIYLVATRATWPSWLIAGLWIPNAIATAHRFDRNQPTDTVSDERVRAGPLFFRSVLSVLILPNSLIWIILGNDLWKTVDDASWIGCWAAFYFLACCRQPPKPKRARAPWFAAFARSRTT